MPWAYIVSYLPLVLHGPRPGLFFPMKTELNMHPPSARSSTSLVSCACGNYCLRVHSYTVTQPRLRMSSTLGDGLRAHFSLMVKGKKKTEDFAPLAKADDDRVVEKTEAPTKPKKVCCAPLA